jgi:DNA-directed RNA polymerase specialized sigma24 family protein
MSEPETFKWPDDWQKAIPSVERYLGLRCQRWGLQRADFEEVVSIVNERIWLATFVPNQKTGKYRTFANVAALCRYADRVARNAMLRLVARNTRRKETAFVDSGSPPPPEESDVTVEGCLAVVPAELKEVAQLRLIEHLSIRKIASRLEISEHQARTLVNKFVTFLRRRFKTP